MFVIHTLTPHNDEALKQQWERPVVMCSSQKIWTHHPVCGLWDGTFAWASLPLDQQSVSTLWCLLCAREREREREGGREREREGGGRGGREREKEREREGGRERERTDLILPEQMQQSNGIVPAVLGVHIPQQGYCVLDILPGSFRGASVQCIWSEVLWCSEMCFGSCRLLL